MAIDEARRVPYISPFPQIHTHSYLPSMRWTHKTHYILREIIAFVWKEFGSGLLCTWPLPERGAPEGQPVVSLFGLSLLLLPFLFAPLSGAGMSSVNRE